MESRPAPSNSHRSFWGIEAQHQILKSCRSATFFYTCITTLERAFSSLHSCKSLSSLRSGANPKPGGRLSKPSLAQLLPTFRALREGERHPVPVPVLTFPFHLTWPGSSAGFFFPQPFYLERGKSRSQAPKRAPGWAGWKGQPHTHNRSCWVY